MKYAPFRPVNLCAYMLIGGIIVTSLMNKDLRLGFYKLSSYTLGLLYAAMIFLFLNFIEYVAYYRKQHVMFRTFFRMTLLTCLIVDMLIVLVGRSTSAFYFIGDKFVVSYLHLFSCALYYYNYRNPDSKLKHKDWKLYLLLLLSVFISQRVQCATGTVGTLVLAFLLLGKDLFKRIVYSGKAMLLSVLFCTLMSFWFSTLVTYPFVQYVLVDILGEDLTLTGRLRIYEILFQAMEKNPLWGWGQGNGMSFLGYFFSTPNAQNGLFNYITDYGVIGAVLLLCLLYTVCKRVRSGQAYPFLALILTFIILSSVEITFNLQFITYIMMIIPFIANSTKCFQRP